MDIFVNYWSSSLGVKKKERKEKRRECSQAAEQKSEQSNNFSKKAGKVQMGLDRDHMAWNPDSSSRHCSLLLLRVRFPIWNSVRGARSFHTPGRRPAHRVLGYVTGDSVSNEGNHKDTPRPWSWDCLPWERWLELVP